MIETECNIPCGNYLVRALLRYKMADQLHKACLATAHWTGKKYTFCGVDILFIAKVLVIDEVIAQFEYDIPIPVINLELLAKK
jgi:hypothetical protein